MRGSKRQQFLIEVFVTRAHDRDTIFGQRLCPSRFSQGLTKLMLQHPRDATKQVIRLVGSRQPAVDLVIDHIG